MKTTFLSFITYQDNKKEDGDQPTLMFCAILPLPVQLELLVQVLWRNKYMGQIRYFWLQLEFRKYFVLLIQGLLVVFSFTLNYQNKNVFVWLRFDMK